MKKTIDQEDFYRERAETYQKAVKLMFKAILKKTPRGIIIEVLKEEKIIKRDWCANGEQYGPYQNEAKST